MRDWILNCAVIAQLAGLFLLATMEPLRMVFGLALFVGGAVYYRRRQAQRRAAVRRAD